AASGAGARRWRAGAGRSGWLDPPNRRVGAGPRSLQRLDLLARRNPAGADGHRRLARTRARRVGRRVILDSETSAWVSAAISESSASTKLLFVDHSPRVALLLRATTPAHARRLCA